MTNYWLNRPNYDNSESTESINSINLLLTTVCTGLHCYRCEINYYCCAACSSVTGPRRLYIRVSNAFMITTAVKSAEALNGVYITSLFYPSVYVWHSFYIRFFFIKITTLLSACYLLASDPRWIRKWTFLLTTNLLMNSLGFLTVKENCDVFLFATLCSFTTKTTIWNNL